VGLIFSAISVCVLFNIFWYTLAISTGLDLRYLTPEIFGSIVFLLVGLYMMKNGAKKEEGKTQLLGKSVSLASFALNNGFRDSTECLGMRDSDLW
jgi:di/tricarboxylate transporter